MSELFNFVGIPLRLKKTKVGLVDLHIGDHVAFMELYKPYYHHGIVKEVDKDKDTVILIEFTPPEEDEKMKIRQKLSLWRGSTSKKTLVRN